MFDKELYRKVKPEFIKSIQRNGFEFITDYCVLTGLSLFVAYEFIKEEYPEKSDWCDFNINRLKKIYRYK